jgi:hypothetical protein
MLKIPFLSWWVSQPFYFWPGFCWILLRVVFLLRNRRPVFAWVRVRHPVILFDRFFTLKFEVRCGDSSCSRQQHMCRVRNVSVMNWGCINAYRRPNWPIKPIKIIGYAMWNIRYTLILYQIRIRYLFGRIYKVSK